MALLLAAVVSIVSATAGALLWTLTEYAMHRFAMHGGSRNPLAAEHRRHHRDPLLTSPLLRTLGHLGIWVLAGLGAVALSFVTGPAPAVGLAVGWAGGYSAYELLHWRSHHREPSTRYTRWLRAHHRVHHVGGPGRNIGVTTALWDHVFGSRA